MSDLDSQGPDTTPVPTSELTDKVMGSIDGRGQSVRKGAEFMLNVLSRIANGEEKQHPSVDVTPEFLEAVGELGSRLAEGAPGLGKRLFGAPDG
jgi:hypothetical protein